MAPTPCERRSAFATYISGENYVPGALCLHGRLKLLSDCPLLFVLDDIYQPLAKRTLATLVRTVGRRHVHFLTELQERLPDYATKLSQEPIVWPDLHHPNYTVGDLVGRRLYQGRAATFALYAKLWVWALLPWRKVALLDADMLVLHDPSDVFRYDVVSYDNSTSAGSRIAASEACVKRNFNSGFIVFQPSLAVLRRLLSYQASVRGSDPLCLRSLTPPSMHRVSASPVS